MMLRDAIDQYIEWRRVHGTKFETGGRLLHHFCRTIGENISCGDVTDAQVLAFLTGKRPLTRTRANKYGALAGFYVYAIGRGYTSNSPLPVNEPKTPSPAPPYIYSRDDLQRLFAAIPECTKRAVQLDAHTLHTFLLLLYGTGLRLGEACRLTLADVDLSAAVLTVRDTKFYKSRLVPVGPQLTDVVRQYAAQRASGPLPEGKDSAFLANRDGTQVKSGTVQSAFFKLRCIAGIHGTDDVRQSPCLHSFRHSFAVHRLTAWYHQGADVQHLLPVLSTYLGHADLAGTQVYLSMTPELLQQASLHFERYARGGNDE